MTQITITEEELNLILKRRELTAKRTNTQKPAHKPKDAILGENRPPGWDEHCTPCKVHRGRVTDSHPLYWFEEEIFKNITNMQHQDQHMKINTILGLPVQNVYRDRQYHCLSHLEALWQQEMLPLKYKIKYEAYKALHGIGVDNVHPAHKTEKPDYVHPIPKVIRPWNSDGYGQCDETEKFVAGKKYRYKYDDEIGYSFAKAYK